MILDIDGGMPTVDLELGLWDTSGLLVANNDDGGILDLGTAHLYDSYIDLASLSSGFYYIGVSQFPSSQANGFDIGGSGFTTTEGYTLNISSGAVPEPTSMMLVLFSGLTLSLRRRR